MVATPTILPRSPLFPTLLPKPPQPHPIPLPPAGHPLARMSDVRDLNKQMDDLSEEEDELEDLNSELKNRGFNFLIPIGRTYTQQEEKNDTKKRPRIPTQRRRTEWEAKRVRKVRKVTAMKTMKGTWTQIWTTWTSQETNPLQINS
ncbi:hypothetical protein C8Q75DRAFT_507557 [Abortiporus biennis]|nr:hypothetical protein C8Q75DRAFT_507557 [Abortiporus biennis]